MTIHKQVKMSRLAVNVCGFLAYFSPYISICYYLCEQGYVFVGWMV